MRQLLFGLAESVRRNVLAHRAGGHARSVEGHSPGGDAQFDVDAVAERTVRDYLDTHADESMALYTEDGSLERLGTDPQHVLVVDPIDGTRPASAGLEMAMVSVAVAPMGDGRPTIGDVSAGLLLELNSGAWMYGDSSAKGIETHGYPSRVPRLSETTGLSAMFWSLELNGHPMDLMAAAYGHLVDASANPGGVFVFNSASFSISRVVTGQLDAYVDIGNRVLRDHPSTEDAFRAAGHGSILHLFPYDIAAAAFLARKAGVVITDAYGEPLDDTLLLDISAPNQRSCIAASNPLLHERLLGAINWDLSALEARAQGAGA